MSVCAGKFQSKAKDEQILTLETRCESLAGLSRLEGRTTWKLSLTRGLRLGCIDCKWCGCRPGRAAGELR